MRDIICLKNLEIIKPRIIFNIWSKAERDINNKESFCE